MRWATSPPITACSASRWKPRRCLPPRSSRDVLGGSAERQGRADPRQAQAGAVLAQPGARSRRHRHQDIGQRRLRSLCRRPLPAVHGRLQRPAQRHRRAADASLDFLASHPNAPQRIELGAAPCPASSARRASAARDRDSFLAGIDGLLFGDTPEEGYVRGTTFLHPGPRHLLLGAAGLRHRQFGSGGHRDRPGRHGDPLRRRGDRPEPRRWPTMCAAAGSPGSTTASVRPRRSTATRRRPRAPSAEGWQFDITVIRAGGQVYRLLTAAPVGQHIARHGRALGRAAASGR